jgi:superfamily I DNA/RNA helicase
MNRAELWRPADGFTLEPNALSAVTTATANLVVTAGPGAGKTELLAQRADFLLRTGHCRYPRRILAISFKVDAARNLRERVRQRCGPELAARLDSYTFHGFSKRLIDQFRLVLKGNDALDADYTVGRDRVAHRQIDFDSMAPLARTILETSELAKAALLQTYGFVFLDEFQDCTANQYALINAAFQGSDVSLIAVGDVKQRIMGWAGALDGVMARFAEEFQATALTLYLNHRSQPRLLRVQNAMIRVLDPPAALADEDLPGEEGVAVVRHFESADLEAGGLVGLINEWITSGSSPEQIAVLVSKQPELYSQQLAEALDLLGIGYRQEGALQDLASEPVAQLIADFLSVACGEREPAAYERLLRVTTAWQATDEAVIDRIHRHVLKLARDTGQRVAATTDAVPEVIDELVALIGDEVLLGLSPSYQQGQRLSELLAEVKSSLAELIERTGSLRDALHTFTGRNAIRIMTIHKSKGLEFDHVVVLGVERESFFGEINAERSAFFVAISRARRSVVLTACATRALPSGARNWRTQRSPQNEFLGYVLDSA